VTEVALSVESLSKSYGEGPVLGGLSLSVARGGCTAVLGPSGCGKSTLLRVVAGLARADAGRVTIAGRVTDDPGPRVPPERRGVGFVFQDLALWPHLDVRGNLAFVLGARGVRGDDATRRIEEAVLAVGLPAALLARRPGELSGGERQRAAIARVLVQDPALLLLDEPLTNRVQILAMLRRLRAGRGLSALFVTHDRDEAFALADRVVILRRGRVEQEGTPQEVYAAPATRYAAGLVGTASFLPVERAAGELRTALGAWPEDGVPGGPLVAVVRPEAIRLDERGAVRGRLTDAFYRGDHWLHAVEVGEGRAAASVLVRSDRPAAAGEPVGLATQRPVFVRDDGSEEA
jgi:ABC-type Fe3+/spermidine/putrescine transport system ATPase subunit